MYLYQKKVKSYKISSACQLLNLFFVKIIYHEVINFWHLEEKGT